MSVYTFMRDHAGRLGLVTRGGPLSWAVFSPCDRYRYALGRTFPTGLFSAIQTEVPFSISMLNPSTADENVLDPTLRRCESFARREGCTSMLVTNLFAWRSTDPNALADVDDPVGAANLVILSHADVFPKMIRVAGWGAFSMRQAKRLRELAAPAMAVVRTERGLLRLGSPTQSGDPRHPLYLTGAVPLVPA